MRRRDVLRVAGSTSIVGLAGCASVFETPSASAPPMAGNRPDTVYHPTHYEGMKMAGMKQQDGYKCALTYSYPHRFWLMKPNGTTKVDIQSADSVHIMPVVWDAQTGIIPPDINPQLTITQNGESIDQFAPWPMLSQPMGFHFGDNAQLQGDGTHTVEVSIGGPSTRRTGSLAENQGNASFEFEFEFSESTLDEISYTDISDDKEGTRGAVDLMDMVMIPDSQVPTPDALPGDVRGSEMTGDARFVVTVLEDASRFGGDGEQKYLAVSPRTPYNRTMLPMMSLSVTLRRDGASVFDGILQSTINPELRYHYGTTVSDVQTGDELTITVDSPPQTARHEGYETAFVDMPEIQMTL
ncbi:hypothetical protein [Halorubrum sp. CBA1229]|jgi:hypothetical protein|uniref:DUF7350 domain-containing protein n=1 Tax=Halorubrum sp. CBA1229 TaxID=1853699 RepID=UPI000F3C1B7A|nr:hypothetical protein [Halorubrum sp. CBA1229]QKY18527.1 hypothetical protein Hrr1229_016520 [Halorubrum sp. CBA1229]